MESFLSSLSSSSHQNLKKIVYGAWEHRYQQQTAEYIEQNDMMEIG